MLGEDGVELVPLSQCALWRDERSFYVQEGPEAWNGQVPFYITSNPYLAHAYAACILRYLQDLRQRQDDGPAVVLELGAGHGAFSFHVLRCLAELHESCPMLSADFVYVMTDMAERNVEHWRAHPALAPFVASGLLDFAFFDVEAPADLELLVRGRRLALDRGPLVVICNYVFDSVACDLFAVRQGSLREILLHPELTVSSYAETVGPGAGAGAPERREVEVAGGRYAPPLDAVLSDRSCHLEGDFLFPRMALFCLSHLHAASGGEMLLLLADRGSVDAARQPEADRLALGIHGGCISTSLDFYACERLALRLQGDAYLCPSGGIVLGAFSFGARFGELPETRLALAQLLGILGPGHLYDVAEHLLRTKLEARLEGILALLEMTLWDPLLFDPLLPVILAALPDGEPEVLERLAGSLGRITANFFYLPAASDTFFQVGLVFQELQRYEPALAAYEASLAWFGEAGGTFYNMGLCRYRLGNLEEARKYFEASLRLTPDSIEALGWIAQIEVERQAGNRP